MCLEQCRAATCLWIHVAKRTGWWRLPSHRRRTPRQRLGDHGEALAIRWLASRRYTVEARNVRCRFGEIDIVALAPDDTRCFVEVRCVSSPAWGGAPASVTDRKRRRLVRAARWYLQRHPLGSHPARFDVLAIQWTADGAPLIEHIEGAFTADQDFRDAWLNL